MKDSLQPGVAKTVRIQVDRGRTIDFMGEALRVYATPELIRDIEMTARNLIVDHADEGEDSVGTLVDVAHLGATMMGNWVDVSVTVAAVDGQSVRFDVAAHDAVEQVGKGSHTRFVVQKDRLAGGLRKKAEKLNALS